MAPVGVQPGEALQKKSLQHAIGSSCCFGGDRQKFYSFFGTSEEIYDELSRPCPGHEGLLSYEVTRNTDGALHYPTEEESEYPKGLCVAYARGLKRQMAKEKVFEAVVQEQREEWYQAQLKDSAARLSDPKVAIPLATYLFRMEVSMVKGTEVEHLRQLLRSASMRGADVRFQMQVGTEEEQHEVPYPALRWKWRTVTSYRWRQDESFTPGGCMWWTAWSVEERSPKEDHPVPGSTSP